MTLVLKGRKG